jgi:undecaprenyl diphosphate synthase
MSEPADQVAVPLAVRPRHVAIVMDGNGRWATRRNLPRAAGHREGVKAARRIVEACGRSGVEVLTLFAFSSENWRRPRTEVNLLLKLFLTALRSEVRRLVESDVRLRFIGERAAFPEKLRKSIDQAENDTKHCQGLDLVVAANYGGRWDIVNAARSLAEQVASGRCDPAAIDMEAFRRHTCIADLPEPDLFIRTGGEYRISNFLLWQMAYTELYFTDCLWPDFGPSALELAFADFANRQRRFGLITEQLTGSVDA